MNSRYEISTEGIANYLSLDKLHKFKKEELSSEEMAHINWLTKTNQFTGDIIESYSVSNRETIHNIVSGIHFHIDDIVGEDRTDGFVKRYRCWIVLGLLVLFSIGIFMYLKLSPSNSTIQTTIETGKELKEIKEVSEEIVVPKLTDTLQEIEETDAGNVIEDIEEERADNRRSDTISIREMKEIQKVEFNQLDLNLSEIEQLSVEVDRKEKSSSILRVSNVRIIQKFSLEEAQKSKRKKKKDLVDQDASDMHVAPEESMNVSPKDWPKYKGGDQKLRNDLLVSIGVIDMGGQNKLFNNSVLVEFVVTQKGNIQEIRLGDNVPSEVRTKVTRALGNISSFQPGKKFGKKSKVKYVLSIAF